MRAVDVNEQVINLISYSTVLTLLLPLNCHRLREKKSSVDFFILRIKTAVDLLCRNGVLLIS
jgi:hypothetical protein